ncbi:MAG: HNH endonuclease [Nostoc sp.]|nr:HNH endonuclease [Nostoc sp. JL34]
MLEVDHKIPKSQGGKDIYDNLQLLHRLLPRHKDSQ